MPNQKTHEICKYLYLRFSGLGSNIKTFFFDKVPYTYFSDFFKTFRSVLKKCKMDFPLYFEKSVFSGGGGTFFADILKKSKQLGIWFGSNVSET